MLKNGLESVVARLTINTPSRTLTPFISPLQQQFPRKVVQSRIGSYHCQAEPTKYRFRPQSLTSSIYAQARFVSTKPLPIRGPIFHFFYRSFAYAGAFILVSGGLVIAFFIYDATTYHETPDVDAVPVSIEALNPRRGGPKNLPIVRSLIDDEDCDENRSQKAKPRLVVLGSGWGSVALLKNLRKEDYHVTVISPSNYFLFTPMLPSATVGTLELRSLVEPIRRIVNRVRGHFLKASAVDVEFSEKLVEVAQTDCHGVDQHFYIPYDHLIVGVGSTTNPHGVKGLENCHYLKKHAFPQHLTKSVAAFYLS